ncbi:MAG TPA: bifunctional DNA-formamidopyrimidine glycosylase/DNA-(apurinic or apyrimidinic site) lyase [Steroidobacteraceae bacterium]|jgi:formamidopyrimidine-DNA glycosylase
MPELPEVETTRRGLEPHLTGQTILRLTVREHRLRWPVDARLPQTLAGQRVESVDRRAKYLLLRLTHGTVLWHLGMSGSLRLVPSNLPAAAHDHIDLALTSGHTVRFNDPRRFGSLHYVTGDPQTHPLLAKLAPEPFDAAFDAQYLWSVARRRKVSIKQLIMNGQLVTGVGNIYASEALFQCGVRPRRTSHSLTRVEAERLVAAIRKVLRQAIRVGGTTLRDYVNPDGNPGYFRQQLFVYERADEPCRNCKTLVRVFTQGQRSTYYCPTCQR